MCQLVELPVELLLDILSLALHTNPTTSSILRLNSHFLCTSLRILHTDLYFRSSTQVNLFRRTNLTCAPRSLTLDLAGGATDTYLFTELQGTFFKCKTYSQAQGWANIDDKGRLMLDLLKWRLNSHTKDPNLWSIYSALSYVHPRRFVWTGPDPPHHFSTAIVPTATTHLFRALSTYTNLTHLKLTNIAFPPPTHPSTLIIPDIPALRTIYIGQATFLSPSSIAALVLGTPAGEGVPAGSRTNLEEIRLVDAYQESIWGPRLRRSDIEAVALAVNEDEEEVLERVRRLVRCEAKTERIVGGDRVDTSNLD